MQILNQKMKIKTTKYNLLDIIVFNYFSFYVYTYPLLKGKIFFIWIFLFSSLYLFSFINENISLLDILANIVILYFLIDFLNNNISLLEKFAVYAYFCFFAIIIFKYLKSRFNTAHQAKPRQKGSNIGTS